MNSIQNNINIGLENPIQTEPFEQKWTLFCDAAFQIDCCHTAIQRDNQIERTVKCVSGIALALFGVLGLVVVTPLTSSVTIAIGSLLILAVSVYLIGLSCLTFQPSDTQFLNECAYYQGLLALSNKNYAQAHDYFKEYTNTNGEIDDGIIAQKIDRSVSIDIPDFRRWYCLSMLMQLREEIVLGNTINSDECNKIIDLAILEGNRCRDSRSNVDLRETLVKNLKKALEGNDFELKKMCFW